MVGMGLGAADRHAFTMTKKLERFERLIEDCRHPGI
jgi:hypothetical protein